MKQSVTWVLKIEGANAYRTIDQRQAQANARKTKEARQSTAIALAGLVKPALYMAPEHEGAPPPANRYVVTLTRISPGRIDDHDNLSGGTLKAVVDQVTAWLGLKSDNDSRIDWQYGQQGCPLKQFGVRVEIEDLAPGDDVVRIIGDVPTRLSNVPSEGKAKRHALPPPPPQEQGLGFTRPCLAAPPWLEDGVVVEVPIDGEPPMSIRMRVPSTALASSLCRLRPGTLVG